MRRGEVWWHEPPDSKRRPILILTRDEAVDRVFNVIAVPATGTVRGLATEVEIGPADGMPIECVLALDNTLSAEKAFPDRAHHDAWPRKDGRGLLGARHGDELPLTEASSVPCSRSIAVTASWFKYRPVRAILAGPPRG